jgi:anti-sigma factor RsiW
MSHPDEGVLQELLDGELAPADATVVRAHLAGCVPCSATLDELKALQVDADAIVARLPLDPRLARPARRASPRRPLNLRLIGLAASALLVAGTSWVLFRSTPRPALVAGDRADTGTGVPLPLPLPLPAEERKEIESTAPAARQEAPKREVQKLEAPKPEAPRKDISLDAARPAAGAMQRAATPSSTVAEAESRLGVRLRTIDGLTPVSVEVMPPSSDSMLSVRQRYLIDGVPVVLLQQATGRQLREEVTSKERSSTLPAGPPATRTWDAGGNHFVLQGALPADSLDALMKRVK